MLPNRFVYFRLSESNKTTFCKRCRVCISYCVFCLQCDSAQQLTNVRQLRVVKYRYDPEFSDHCGLDTQSDTGIIAQELRNILPEAVMPAGDIILPSGTRIDNFLVVNKVIISLCLYA